MCEAFCVRQFWHEKKNASKIKYENDCSEHFMHGGIIPGCNLGRLLAAHRNLFPLSLNGGQARCGAWQGPAEPGEQAAGQVPSRGSLH